METKEIMKIYSDNLYYINMFLKEINEDESENYRNITKNKIKFYGNLLIICENFEFAITIASKIVKMKENRYNDNNHDNNGNNNFSNFAGNNKSENLRIANNFDNFVNKIRDNPYYLFKEKSDFDELKIYIKVLNVFASNIGGYLKENNLTI